MLVAIKIIKARSWEFGDEGLGSSCWPERHGAPRWRSTRATRNAKLRSSRTRRAREQVAMMLPNSALGVLQ